MRPVGTRISNSSLPSDGSRSNVRFSIGVSRNQKVRLPATGSRRTDKTACESEICAFAGEMPTRSLIKAGVATDSVLRRLMEDTQAAVHLVTDIDHGLLAASKPREKEWRRSVAELAGISLRRFASDRIEAAKRGLADGDWWRQTSVSPAVVHHEEAETGLRIAHGKWCGRGCISLTEHLSDCARLADLRGHAFFMRGDAKPGCLSLTAIECRRRLTERPDGMKSDAWLLQVDAVATGWLRPAPCR